jgi:hypothetical protein
MLLAEHLRFLQLLVGLQKNINWDFGQSVILYQRTPAMRSFQYRIGYQFHPLANFHLTVEGLVFLNLQVHNFHLRKLRAIVAVTDGLKYESF